LCLLHEGSDSPLDRLRAWEEVCRHLLQELQVAQNSLEARTALQAVLLRRLTGNHDPDALRNMAAFRALVEEEPLPSLGGQRRFEAAADQLLTVEAACALVQCHLRTLADRLRPAMRMEAGSGSALTGRMRHFALDWKKHLESASKALAEAHRGLQGALASPGFLNPAEQDVRGWAALGEERLALAGEEPAADLLPQMYPDSMLPDVAEVQTQRNQPVQTYEDDTVEVARVEPSEEASRQQWQTERQARQQQREQQRREEEERRESARRTAQLLTELKNVLEDIRR
jgi:hypothetical protein